MNFVESVNSALIKKYATFKGRACRAEWWYFLLFTHIFIVTIVLTLYSFLPGGGFVALIGSM